MWESFCREVQMQRLPPLLGGATTSGGWGGGRGGSQGEG